MNTECLDGLNYSGVRAKKKHMHVVCTRCTNIPTLVLPHSQETETTLTNNWVSHKRQSTGHRLYYMVPSTHNQNVMAEIV